MENKDIPYEDFIKLLVYDLKKNQPINEEAEKLLLDDIHTKSHDNFNNYFLAVSKHYKQPMSVKRSNLTNHYYSFKCSVPGCQMIVVFSTKNGLLFLNERKTIFKHTETVFHPICPRLRMNETTFQAFNNLSEERLRISDIKKLYPDISSCSVKTLYGIRTKINKELNTIDSIKEEMCKHPNYSILTKINENKAIVTCAVINREIVRTNYCDIITIDDTSGVSKLNYSVEIVVCKDANEHLQMVGFGFLPDSTKNGFSIFLETFKELVEKERVGVAGNFGSIIVCDRSQAQTGGVKNVFKESKIIYCKVHLLRNLKDLKDSVLLTMAEAMFQTRTIGTENMFKQLCEKTGVGKGMLKVGDCFLPSKVDKLYHRNILTSNLAEASFSTLKNKLNSITQPSLTLIKELIDMSDDWMRHSKQEMRENIPRILEDKHITSNIGNWALRLLTKEIKRIPEVLPNEVCHCNKNIYQLPCVHDIIDPTKTFENSIPKEYFTWGRHSEDITELIPQSCEIRQIQWEPSQQDLKGLVEILYAGEGTLDFRNELSFKIKKYIMSNRNKWETTPKLPNPCPGHIRYSKNCDKSFYTKKKKDKGKEKGPKKTK